MHWAAGASAARRAAELRTGTRRRSWPRRSRPSSCRPARTASRPATEALVGPYELHDFFLHHLLRFGCPAGASILSLHGTRAFDERYEPAQSRRWLRLHRRFFANQFKRSALPDGPKVGTVSLSPRGDWRMPSDASAAAWLAELD